MKKFTIEMEDGGVMKGEIYEDIAPETAANFEKLANEGFYDGLIFHRVIPGFIDLKHERGVLSMARAMDPNSAGSQFFIMTSTSPHLDGQYAAFGKVTEGMATADKIVNARRDFRDKPLLPQKIKSIRVEG